nr:right-handed parallel beta-helix repeat-containing protein [Halorussus sp. JP-T4]
MTRRDALRAAGATVGAGALAGCGGPDPGTTRETTSGATPTTSPGTESTTTGTEPTTRSANDLVDPTDYETVVDVAEAGADTDGEELINPVVEEHVGDDTLLYFPTGRYLLGGWRVTDYRNLAVVGDDATLVAPPDVNYWLMWGGLEDLLFAGFTIDCRGENVAPIAHVGVTRGDNVVRDVTVRGHRYAPKTAFEVEVTDPDGSLLFDGLSLPDGSTTGHSVYVFPESVGELTFRDCRIEHWKEGLYAAYHRGPLRIEGGYYANNGIEQVRVGGGTEGAVVKDVTIRVDNPRQAQNKPNMRGIWAEEGAHVRIENCDIAITDLTGTYSSGGIVVEKQFGEAVVENTRVRTDVEAYALSVRDPIDSMEGQTVPSLDSLPERTRFSASNLRIEGAATSGTAIRVNRRDDCTFENICVQHPKGDRDGLLVAEADGCSVSDSTIDVSGDAVVVDEATVKTERLRRNGSC